MFSWVDSFPGISQAKALVQLVSGDETGARHTQENFVRTYVNLLDSNHFFTSCNSHYCSESKPKMTHAKWMKSLDDAAPITSVTMPGTHDSGCILGGEIGKCQSWSIPDQLNAGIRFLDIRCKNVKDEFHIYHGIINCQLKFSQVISYCERFLAENPSEFLVMRIKEEGKSHLSTRSFSDLYREYFQHQIFIKSQTKELNVGQVRGKVVVLKSFHGIGTGREMDFYQDSILQDYFEPKSIKAKLEKVFKHYYEAKPHKLKFHINFLSACNSRLHAYPRFFAGKCNRFALDLLQNHSNKTGFAGIIVMDFPGEILIRCCIQKNQRLEKKVALRSLL